MADRWQLEPATATSIIAAAAAVEIPTARFTSALAALTQAMRPSDTVRHAAETFNTRHRDVPARLAQRITDVTAAGTAVVTTIDTGDDLMAAEVRLAAAATTETTSPPLQGGPR